MTCSIRHDIDRICTVDAMASSFFLFLSLSLFPQFIWLFFFSSFLFFLLLLSESPPYIYYILSFFFHFCYPSCHSGQFASCNAAFSRWFGHAADQISPENIRKYQKIKWYSSKLISAVIGGGVNWDINWCRLEDLFGSRRAELWRSGNAASAKWPDWAAKERLRQITFHNSRWATPEGGWWRRREAGGGRERQGEGGRGGGIAGGFCV